MAKTFKVLSALLSYPSAELQHAAGEFGATLAAEALLSPAARRGLDQLIGEIAGGDLYDLQENYILLFDRTRSLSLHLFEHVHGESRDRGQAMIDLKSLYEQKGLALSAAELPDFLPLFLEFLSTLPVAEAHELLRQTAHISSVLGQRLEKREQAYAAIFTSLAELAGAALSDAAPVVEENDADPNDLAALDDAWEDKPVTFGPEAAGGCRDTLISKIRAGRRPAAGVQSPRGAIHG
jgi:nitrate reductase delta subunit